MIELRSHENKKDKLRKMGLFRLWRESFITRRQTKEIKTANLAIEKIYASLSGLTDLPLAMKYLSEAEEILHRAKVSVRWSRIRNKRVFGEDYFEGPDEEMIAEFRFTDTLEFIAGLKLLIRIILAGKTHQGILEEMASFFNWLGFDSHQVNLSVTEEVIGQSRWEVITIENSKCITWDDMSPVIRRRRLGLKEIFEGAGGEFCYQSSLTQGTKIILKVPPLYLTGENSYR